MKSFSASKSLSALCVCCLLALVFLPVFSACEKDVVTETQTISLSVVQSPVEITVGSSIRFTAEQSQGNPVEWISADDSVVTVSDGLVSGVSVGNTIIYAISGDVFASCQVVVTQAAAEPDDNDSGNAVIVSLTPVTVEVGESFTLEAVSPTGGTIVWFSQDADVATVKDGVIAGISAGETTVSASVGSATVICKVVVADNVVHPTPAALQDAYVLSWSDEFDGTELDLTKWSYQLGTGIDEGLTYWGNNEQQYYTSSAENVGVSDGNLYITAQKESAGDRDYTSSRIFTRGNYYFTYGYIEAKIKLPTGTGLWPAFWMLPQPSSDNTYGGWPSSGEIDILEARGRVTSSANFALHTAKTLYGTEKVLSDSAILATPISDWHTYGIEWTSDYITWYVDGQAVVTYENTSWGDSSYPTESAPFDKPFYILLNLAVGGNYDSGQTPDETFTSATMLVDYVRVFKKVFA